MKEKIIIFIIGLLLGAIISTGSIYFYTVASDSKNDRQMLQTRDGNPPSNQNGQMGGEPPEMPNGNNQHNNDQLNNN